MLCWKKGGGRPSDVERHVGTHPTQPGLCLGVSTGSTLHMLKTTGTWAGEAQGLRRPLGVSVGNVKMEKGTLQKKAPPSHARVKQGTLFKVRVRQGGWLGVGKKALPRWLFYIPQKKNVQCLARRVALSEELDQRKAENFNFFFRFSRRPSPR